MKNFIRVLSSLLLFAAFGFGQTILTNTTLSTAVSDSSTTFVVVASATGINAPSTQDNTKSTFLYVDRELMDVRAINSTTIQVVRGAEGTTAVPHASSAFVFVVPSLPLDLLPHHPARKLHQG
jgi:hypothetical protein